MRAGACSPSSVPTHRVHVETDRQDQQTIIKKEARTPTQRPDDEWIPPQPSSCQDAEGLDSLDEATRRRATYRVLFGQPLLSDKQRRPQALVCAADASSAPVKLEHSLEAAGGRRRSSLELLDVDGALMGTKTALEREDAGEDAILSEFPPVLELAADELDELGERDDLLLLSDAPLGLRSDEAAALKDALASRSGDRPADGLALALAKPESLDEILRLIDANDALSPAVKRPAARKPRSPLKPPVEAVEGVTAVL